MYVITYPQDKQLFKRRLPNVLSVVLRCLRPFREHMKVVAVEPTCNWYWLVDGLQEQGCPVVPANPSKMDQYDGI